MVKLAAPLAATGVSVAAPAVVVPAVTSSVAVSALGTVGMVASGAAVVGTGFALGPLGWVCLGCDADAGGGTTWDCWKDVVREEDPAPSMGRRLCDIATDERVAGVTVFDESMDNFSLILTNKWGDHFAVSPVVLPGGEVAAHAELVRA
jgi:hypothetical protein